MDRVNATIPPKAKEIHKIAGTIKGIKSRVGSSAKLNIKTSNKVNINTDPNNSFDLYSYSKSFLTISKICLKNSIM